ncbi:unnamed protein product [Albugo candida]|uniref:Uncharacterized protein n=1 Tax=Albugo candida TaxID=65357 RepID=A0A024G5R9_9STRA|nr:unnamed protein product [Albugo candida]|eukprot:CCI42002.1 unnamed protein product [Albugo candida]
MTRSLTKEESTRQSLLLFDLMNIKEKTVPSHFKMDEIGEESSATFGFASPMLGHGLQPALTSNPSAGKFNLPIIHTIVHSNREESFPSAFDTAKNLSDGPRYHKAQVNVGIPHASRSCREMGVFFNREDAYGDEKNLGTTVRGGRWSFNEHERFLAGFKAYGHKWKRVQQVVRTRSVTQVRTHAQKYLLKIAKTKKEQQASATNTRIIGLQDTQISQDGTEYNLPTYRRHQAMHIPANARKSSISESSATTDYMQADREALTDVDKKYIAAAAATLCNLMRHNNGLMKQDHTNDVYSDALSHVKQIS